MSRRGARSGRESRAKLYRLHGRAETQDKQEVDADTKTKKTTHTKPPQSESRKPGELPAPPIDDADAPSVAEDSAEEGSGAARSKPSSCRSKPSINRLSPRCPPSDSISFEMLSFKASSRCLVYTNDPWRCVGRERAVGGRRVDGQFKKQQSIADDICRVQGGHGQASGWHGCG